MNGRDMLISVIIPNYNGSEFVGEFFKTLVTQTLSRSDFEVIIVDNGSTDGSLHLLKDGARLFDNVRIFQYAEKRGSYAARNFGVDQSTGRVLTFTDIDCRPTCSWLSKIHEAFEGNNSNLILAGGIELFPRGKDFNYFEWYDKCSALDQERYSRTETAATANLSVTRNLFNSVKGFSEVPSGGDREFCRRATERGGVIFCYRPDIRVLHPARATSGEIRKKALRLAQGYVELKYKHCSGGALLLDLVRQFAGLILQPNQWRIIYRTFQEKGVGCWSWRFILVALWMGFYARRQVIRLALLRIIGPGGRVWVRSVR